MVRRRCCVYPVLPPSRNTLMTHATTGWMRRSTTLQIPAPAVPRKSSGMMRRTADDEEQEEEETGA